MLENIRKTVKIKDLGEVITGTTPPTQHQEYFGGQYIFIKPSDLSTDQRYVFRTEMTLSDEGCDYQKRKLLPKNSICVVCIGTIGKMCLTSKPSFTNQQLNSIIVDQSQYEPIYVYYLMKTYITHVKHLNAGSASGRENVNKSSFEKLEIEVHELVTQRKIAAILSAYDDLIENNTRRIEILEEMARSIYREWFVKFRFPGHEQVQMVDSDLGLIPEGWEITSIGNHINTQKGYAFKSSWYQEEGIKIVKVSDFTDDSIDISKLVSISEEIAEQYKKHELEANDIIIQTVGSWASNPQSVVGKVIRVPKIAAKALLNQNAVKVIPKESINQIFLFYNIKNERFKSYIIGCAQGAASQASITLDAIREFKILLPPSSLLDSLEYFVSPMWKLINNLENKKLNLRCTRDYLLPKLISGKIDVENLDINAGEIAA